MTTTMWGVGQWTAPDGTRQPWEISNAEIERDMASAAAALATIDVGPGAPVLWCSMLSEAGQFWPWIVGTMLRGSQLSCADATAGEAPRVAMFCRSIEFRAVLGVTGAILDGLEELGADCADVFRGVGVVGARPEAVARLRDRGVAAHHFVLVGPAVALASTPDEPARLDPAEWRATAVDGHIAVTALRSRGSVFEQTRTFVRGDVVDGGIMPALS